MNSSETTILHIRMPLCSLLDSGEKMTNIILLNIFLIDGQIHNTFFQFLFTKSFFKSLPFKEKEVKKREERVRPKCTVW